MLVTVSEADTYFTTRLGADAWTNSGSSKTAALQTAENQLAAVYGAVSDKNAVCEQALFLLQDPAADRRASLQAQGVTQAGIVQESYKGAGGILVCPYARQVLGEPTACLHAPLVELEDEVTTYEL